MNTTEMLTGKTTRDFTFHAGKYAKHVPAGSLVLISQNAIESSNRYAYTYLARNTRISEVIPVACIEAV